MKNKRWEKNELIEVYRKIREKHGEKSKSIMWLNTHSYSWLSYCLKNRMGVTWTEFKKMAGFNDNDRHRGWSADQILKAYRQIREKHGDLAKHINWLQKNNYGWLYLKQRRKLSNWSWDDFKKQAGFTDASLRVPKLTRGELVAKYRDILKESGGKAISSKWFCNNGYGWLYRQMRNEKIQWTDMVRSFKKS